VRRVQETVEFDRPKVKQSWKQIVIESKLKTCPKDACWLRSKRFTVFRMIMKKSGTLDIFDEIIRRRKRSLLGSSRCSKLITLARQGLLLLSREGCRQCCRRTRPSRWEFHRHECSCFVLSCHALCSRSRGYKDRAGRK
jgi:hypothetical protein